MRRHIYIYIYIEQADWHYVFVVWLSANIIQPFFFMANCSGNLLIEGKTENGFGNRRVCIVGAGMSGLLATKYLLSRGLNPTVFEAKKGIGGLWRETFSSTKLQTSRPAFQFTDFPWPNHVTNQFPTHSEVMDYFHRYSEHFGLLDHIQFNSKVVEIRYIGQEHREKSLGHAGLWGKNGGPYADSAVWEVGVQKSNGESTEVETDKRIEYACFLSRMVSFNRISMKKPD